MAQDNNKSPSAVRHVLDPMKERAYKYIGDSSDFRLEARLMPACRRVFAVLSAFLFVALLPAAHARAQVRLGGEFQVGSYTTLPQLFPAVASDAAGNFVVVWSTYAVDRFEMRGQRFGPAGAPLGGEFQVASYTSTYDVFPSVAMRGSGDFVVVWSRISYESGPHAQVLGKRFDSSGVPVGADFQVGTYGTYFLQFPSVAVDGAGDFVVSWMNEDYPSSPGVAVQRFDSSATPLGAEIQVNSYTTGLQGIPSIATDSSGNFVVVWTQIDGNGIGVLGQRFDSTGARAGGEFQVDGGTTTYQAYGRVAMSPGGGFVVAWDSANDGDGFGLSARMFDASGTPSGLAFAVNTYTTGSQSSPVVGIDPTGGFTVIWTDRSGEDGDSGGIFGQQFGPTGARLGSEFQVNTGTTGSQQAAAIGMSPNGKFVVAWEGYNQYPGVFAQQFGFALERPRLRFGVVRNGGTLTDVTPPQDVAITVTGAWTAVSDQPFVTVTPSGTGSGVLTVQVANNALLPMSGAAPQAKITVTAASLPNLPQTITVDVQVYAPGTTSPAFGFFDTPIDGSTGVTGAIALTGWAMDDIGVTLVRLWRDPVAGDPPPAANGKILIGDATFVSGARPDVESIYSALPRAYRGAWGYMLSTNLLPNRNTSAPAGGVGTFTVYAYVYDVDGHQTILPSRTFTCDNTVATKPFGTIDTPAQGATVSGTITNFGWVLTPQPGTMPSDGHTIVLFIDNIPRGTATYGGARADLATLFPGYNNTSGPVGVFSIDTTALPNGVHTIAWSATDDLLRADGIGSRYFTVLN